MAIWLKLDSSTFSLCSNAMLLLAVELKQNEEDCEADEDVADISCSSNEPELEFS